MLTPKQEKFCLVYLETGNASEAYRQAYNTAKMKPLVINVKAKELLDNGNIAVRIKELRAPAIKAAQVTVENHLNSLLSLREAAEAAEQWSAAIRAEELRGKVSGFYRERIEHYGPGGTPLKLKIEFVTTLESDEC